MKQLITFATERWTDNGPRSLPTFNFTWPFPQTSYNPFIDSPWIKKPSKMMRLYKERYFISVLYKGMNRYAS